MGGWGEEGVDPALYAKGIMKGCKEFYDEKGNKDPVEIIKAGWIYANKVSLLL